MGVIMKREVCRLEKILRGNIRIFMIKKKYNQTKLCKKANIDISNFNMFLKQKRGLPMVNLERIAKVLKVKPEKLFDPYYWIDPMVPRWSLVIDEKKRKSKYDR